MKHLFIVAAPLLVAACVTTTTPPSAPPVTSEAAKACVRQCQGNYSSCNGGCRMEGISAMRCQTNCGAVLGDCYKTCE